MLPPMTKILSCIGIAIATIWVAALATHFSHAVYPAEGGPGAFDYEWHWFDIPLWITAFAIVAGSLVVASKAAEEL